MPTTLDELSGAFWGLTSDRTSKYETHMELEHLICNDTQFLDSNKNRSLQLLGGIARTSIDYATTVQFSGKVEGAGHTGIRLRSVLNI